MKSSTPTALRPQGHKQILLVGPPGQGKTKLLMEFPGIYIADADQNLDGPENFIRKTLNPNLAYLYDSVPVNDDGTPVPEYDRYPRLLKLLGEAYKNPVIKGVGVDGLTHLDNDLKWHIMKKQMKTTMDRQDWIPFRIELLSMLSKMRGAGKTTIMLCHEEIKTKEIKGQGEVIVGYYPAVSSKITDYFGGFFTDIWRCSLRPKAGGLYENWINTMPTGVSDLKNSMGLPAEMKADWNEIFKYWKPV